MNELELGEITMINGGGANSGSSNGDRKNDRGEFLLRHLLVIRTVIFRTQ